MPNTYTQLYIQLVFAVKGRLNLINSSFREEVEKYIRGIINHKNHKALAIYGMPDHIHILVGLNPAQSISDLVKEIKVSSCTFIKEKKFAKNFYWQEGYGAFSYAKSQLSNVINYIVAQPIHHKQKSFRKEYVEFLERFEIDYDKKYLFEFYEE